jgi:signal transduction histidine kinase
MNHKLLLRVTMPAVAIALLLFAACLVSVLYIHRLQANLAAVLSRDVASLQAAQELEIRVRQLRFHTLLYLSDPTPNRLEPIDADQQHFEDALGVAQGAAQPGAEGDCVRAIGAAYDEYRREQAGLRAAASEGHAPGNFAAVADSHPIKLVVEPCQQLLRINKDKLDAAALESRRVSEQGYLAMLFLGLAGPVGGLAVGYGVARGLRQSIYRLSVRVQDAAQRLDRDVGSVSVVADGDLTSLDRQLQHVVRKVEEAAERLQRHQRELLRAEQLAAVGQLAAGVAHEVRNPLTGIKMLVEVALRAKDPRPLEREDLEVIRREVARLEQTVQGFLDFARLPAPHRSRGDVRDDVAGARDLVRVRAQGQGVTVNVTVPEVPAEACVDHGQVRTVLVNLLLNALDATPGGGRVDVDLEPTPGGGLRLSVADTGSGIPEQVAQRLFTPFATTKPTGTGLGLSLSRRIAEEHGGTLTAANRPGGGAEFVLTIPAEAGRDDPAGH